MSAVSGEAARTGRFPVLAKYDVLEELGHGGMATVYRAHDKRLDRDVAVKVIHPHLRDSGEVARRFSIEAQAVAKLRHPNIVEVYDVSAEGDLEQYLVVELLRGKTLRKIIQVGGALPPEVAAAIAVELLGALGHAHGQGVIHRDVKPENVIVEHRTSDPGPTAANDAGPSRLQRAEPGDRVAVKLTDFGIAKLLDAQGMTSTGQVLGSPAHMAPEQIEGQDVDGRSDVFGMGVLLYECMVGHLPFEGNNPAQVLRRVLDGVYPSAERERPMVGRPFSEILDRALGRTPDERYDDATAMRDALLAELSRLGVTEPRAELEAYSDDPAGYTEQHDKKMIGRLVERAHASRKRGNAMAAAADYNRALAYAPNDPALLRIVTSIHGAEARRRMLRRVAPLVLGTLLLGTVAFGITRQIAHKKQLEMEPLPPVTAAPLSEAPVTAPLPTDSAHVTSASTGQSSPPLSQGGRPAPPKPVQLEVRFKDVSPPRVVQVVVDGDGKTAADVSTDRPLLLPDNGAHSLKFTCKDKYETSCKPYVREIEAGERVPPLTIHLDLLDATLVVQGNSAHKYALREEDTVKPTSDNPVSVPMHDHLMRTVTVVDLDTGESRSESLIAGQRKAVTISRSTP